MKTCSTCEGRREVYGFIRTTSGCGLGSTPCIDCKGTGTVEERPAEWKVLGQALRQLRQDADMSLREAARRLKLSVVAWSDAERGRRDPRVFMRALGADPAQYIANMEVEG